MPSMYISSCMDQSVWNMANVDTSCNYVMECPFSFLKFFTSLFSLLYIHSWRHMFWIHSTCTIPTSVCASFAELPLTCIPTLVLFLDLLPLNCMCWHLHQTDNVHIIYVHTVYALFSYCFK